MNQKKKKVCLNKNEILRKNRKKNAFQLSLSQQILLTRNINFLLEDNIEMPRLLDI
jgi:hypothetical protein